MVWMIAFEAAGFRPGRGLKLIDQCGLGGGRIEAAGFRPGRGLKHLVVYRVPRQIPEAAGFRPGRGLKRCTTSMHLCNRTKRPGLDPAED